MARPWRIQFPGALYHVASRGNNRQSVYLSDDDRTDFLDLLARVQERFSLEIFTFCLMSNHYHLFLRTPQANLAAALHWLNATYTNHFHRRHRRCGHLFQSRYHAILVTDEAHWLHLSMYIHLNPVRAGLADDPADYKWSSFRDYVRPQARFPWLNRSPILSGYGSTDPARRRNYRTECLMLAGKKPQFGKELINRVVLGSAETLRELARKHPPAGQAETVPDFRQALRPSKDARTELQRVAEAFGKDLTRLRLKARGEPPVRLAAYYHLVEHCGMSVTRVGKLMEVSVSAVSKGLARFRIRLKNNPQLRERMKAISNVKT